MTSTDFNCNVNAPQAVIASFILRCLFFLKKIKRNIHEFYETDPTEASSRLEDRRLVEHCTYKSVDITTGSLAFICATEHMNLKKSHLYFVYSAGEGSKVVKRHYPYHLVHSLPQNTRQQFMGPSGTNQSTTGTPV